MISQREKDSYGMVSLIYRTESRRVKLVENSKTVDKGMEGVKSDGV